MKRIRHLILLSLSFLFSHANAQWSSGSPIDSITDGQNTLIAIQNQYHDTAVDCGTVNRPAFLCNGLLLRVTKKSNAYRVWDPSPISIARHSISFSFLRADAKFSNFAWNLPDANGYIIYPNLLAPPGKIPVDVLCSFPKDSWDWYRDVPCGSITLENGKYFQASRLCALQGITTAQQWLQHWNDSASFSDPYLSQCGFDVRKTVPGGSIPFMESIKAKNLLGFAPDWNDLQVTAWPPKSGSTLPIQAFFFTTAASLADAQANQQEFYTDTGIIVPILSLKLPTSAQEEVVFGFSSSNQAVTGPGAPTTALTRPTIVEPAEGATVSSPFTISGKSAPYAEIEVYPKEGAYLLGKTTAGSDGTWRIPAATMASYDPITARQTLNGQTSNWADDRNFSLNTSTCTSYIASASWLLRYDPGTNKEQWTLSVIPTACGRLIGPDKTDAAYQELVQKYANDPQWKNNDGGGMRRQFVCHLAIAKNKAEWNLEPFRPNVSHETAVAEKCNPI